MTLQEAIVGYVATGLVAGTIAGLLGVGGGLIIVPTLLWIFARRGYDSSVSTQLAIGTSLAVIVLTATSSVSAHHARGAVRWPVVARLSVGIVVGAALGAWLATRIDGRSLQLGYAAFALLAGGQIFLGKESETRERGLPRRWFAPAGVVVGTFSSLFGIGGGTLTVPLLLWSGMDVRHVVGSSAACGLPIAVSGAVTYAVLGQGNPALPEHAFGFVHLPAFVAIAVASVVTARLGARWAHAIARLHLRKVFAVTLWAVAAKVVLGV